MHTCTHLLRRLRVRVGRGLAGVERQAGQADGPSSCIGAMG